MDFLKESFTFWYQIAVNKLINTISNYDTLWVWLPANSSVSPMPPSQAMEQSLITHAFDLSTFVQLYVLGNARKRAGLTAAINKHLSHRLGDEPALLSAAVRP